MTDFENVVTFPEVPPVAPDPIYLRNSLMAPKVDGGMEITGKIESDNGKTFFDTNKNQLAMTDASGNERVFMGYDD